MKPISTAVFLIASILWSNPAPAKQNVRELCPADYTLLLGFCISGDNGDIVNPEARK